MARGKNFWEITYDPNGIEPDAAKNIQDLKNVSGFENAQVDLQISQGTKRFNVEGKHFANCDFHGGLEKASFRNCQFDGCRFEGAHFTKVKFSKCRFVKCHFLHSDFIDCRFVDGCEFSAISLGVEHFRCDLTEIDVSLFLGSVTTNVAYVPEFVTPEYQNSRLIEEKAKLARILYKSSAEMFGRHFFAAHKELVIYAILAEIESHRFLTGPSKHSSPEKRNRWSFFWRTLFPKIDLAVVRMAGILTKWGHSIAAALLFFLCLVSGFTILYWSIHDVSFGNALLRAGEVSLVAGYTAHTAPTDGAGLRILTFLNLIFGLYWYSLIVPVITRKFLR